MAPYVVTGAAVVLPTEGGGERYLYKGAPVGEGFTEAGLEHALSVGLIEEVAEVDEDKAAAEKAAADKAAVDKEAAEKKAAEDKAAAEKAAADAQQKQGK